MFAFVAVCFRLDQILVIKVMRWKVINVIKAGGGVIRDFVVVVVIVVVVDVVVVVVGVHVVVVRVVIAFRQKFVGGQVGVSDVVIIIMNAIS